MFAKIAKLTALAVILYSAAAFAAPTWHTSKIKRLYPLASGGFVVIFVDDAATCLGNGPGKYHYVTVGQNSVTAEGAAKMYAALMSAGSMDRTVTINFNNATSGCYINRLLVNF